MPGLSIFIALLTGLMWAASARAQTPSPELDKPAETYKFCLDMARAYPAQGFEFSGKWVGLSGGEPAKHCQAVALLGLREYAEAASRLQELAQTSKQDKPVRAGLLAQAAQALLLAEQFEQAFAVQTAALELLPRDPQLLMDRAGTLAAAKNYWQAIDDLNIVIEIEPKNAEALALRASAYRMVEADDLALDDAERALAIDPANISALLERGNLNRMKGETAAARQDWMKILELAPDGDAASAARANIEKLDVNPEK